MNHLTTHPEPRTIGSWKLKVERWKLIMTPEPPARTKKPFYAKQTQFAECSNKHKHCYNNGLCQYTPPQPLQKQSQTNPIQTQFKPNQSQSNPISKQIRRKQTQSNPI